MNETQHAALLNALTKYDMRQSKRKHYNPYALGQYCQALSNARQHCENGADLRLALLNCFQDRLLDVLLKAVNLATSTSEEQRYGGFQRLAPIDD